ncbi:MAG: peptidoglycan DD-metalloendopeptidase family protein [Desulfuromonadaceae bacterium]|nr:peptidoglycan DD-metalloendopeptidase family protein [Desulfuromonadaceae bacterium]MDD2847429.1 peptidoglycan DD-metalloendopeptidase family protein [Desulfuromonadaceae bacterium]MDD4131458.1 peptidoglycan DD-metalloendopeptidase family protein [Desulfuromonadaceae bacterium]
MPIITDFNPPNRHSRHRSWPLLILLFVTCITGAGIIFATMGESRQPDQNQTPPPKDTIAAANAEKIKTIRGTIQTGDTISSLFQGLFNTKDIKELASQCRGVYPLNRISIGQPYNLTLKGGAFKRFAYDIDDKDQLIICRDEDTFSVSRKPIDYTIEQVTIKGNVQSSLSQAVVDIGESEGLAFQLADIFAWDIDFFHDIQTGDSFEMVVEKRYREGKPAGNGRLLAARFTVQDQPHQAFYFKDGSRPPDYYNQKGYSLRKAFLKAPLSFRRISSGFNMRRRHPITKRIKAHPAIDYAAPRGTPIHSVGDGTVTFAANKRYNGKCVKIRHRNGWATMYNHMSRFGKSIRAGRKVRQGELIGYVGSTGLSTGPHLDFRMYKNGKAVNPLKMKAPPARPVSRANMAIFRTIVADRVASMENLPRQQLSRAAEASTLLVADSRNAEAFDMM